MIKHNYIIPFKKFEVLLIVYRIKLSNIDKQKVYLKFSEIFRYDSTFTYLDEDTDLIKFTLNCKYAIEQICYELGILI